MEAINRAIKLATGELIIDCDSDDFFTENAFKVIEENAKQLLNDKEIYALCFLKQDNEKNISRKKIQSRLYEIKDV